MTRLMAVVVVAATMWQAEMNAADPNTSRIRVADKLVERSVSRAVEAAAAQLADPECRKLLTDFTAVDGRPLAEHLRDMERTAPDYLNLLWFLDGSRKPTCQPQVSAFTHPGSRAVYICDGVFGPRTALKTLRNVVIHEMLHTLGLGENGRFPPSGAITQQVELRCGR